MLAYNAQTLRCFRRNAEIAMRVMSAIAATSMAYEGRRANTVDRHRLARSRGTAQEHDEAVAVRYGSIKEPRPLRVVRQVKKRGAQFHELCFLFFREDDVFEMSRRSI